MGLETEMREVEKLNWLVIGIGDITTKRVIPAIQAEPRSNLYGVVSRDPGKGARYCGRAWTDLNDALGDPAIGAVYVATPVYLHRSAVDRLPARSKTRAFARSPWP